MFYNIQRRTFDNGIRDTGGIPQARPSWETTPTDYPIKTLGWSAYMDADDPTTIEDDGASGVITWRSALVHPTYRSAGSSQPFTFFLKEASVRPTLGGGTANPSGTQHISFDGSTQYFKSGAQAVSAERFLYGSYSASAGAGLDEGLWVSVSTTWSFTQVAPAQVPDNTGGPRGVAANSDFLNGPLVSDVLSVSAGLITLAWYGDGTPTAFAPGSVTAQTPWANPAIISDSQGYMGIHFTDAGVTAGFYDDTFRDSGGGPGTNDGWQMVTVPLAAAIDSIIQVRWGAGLLELRVLNVLGWGDWETCDFGPLFLANGNLRPFSDYSNTVFCSGILYSISFDPTYLVDQYANNEARYMAASIGINISEDNAIITDAETLFGYDVTSYAPGFVSWTIGRANSRTTDGTGYQSKSFWQTSNYYISLGSRTVGGVNKWSPDLFDDAGSLDYSINHTVADDTWAMVSHILDGGVLKSRLNGVETSEQRVNLPSTNLNTRAGNQYLTMGYAIGAADYLQGAVSFFGTAITRGWNDARIRDVERYLNATYMTSTSSGDFTYDLFGTFGFFGM